MEQKTELNFLIDYVNAARVFTNFYISKLKDIDSTKEFTLNNQKFNSVYWEIAHIAWAENTLLLLGTGGKRVKLPWLKHFAIGKTYEHTENMPPLSEIMEGMNLIHQTAIRHLKTLNEADLDNENMLNFEFAGEKSTRMIIQHSARHESSHAGHLGWLCKLHGVKTF